jgi:hypothetical protein
MERKLGIAIVILGLAALSPAPINNAKVGSKRIAPQSQAQLAAEQKFNGVVPIVGQVPDDTDEVGRPREGRHQVLASHEGDSTIQLGSKKADKIGASTIRQATQRVETQDSPDRLSWIYGMLLAVAGFLTFKLIQRKIERVTPVPEFSKRFLKEFENSNH